MDRLIELIEQKNNPSVVGLDPTPALLPETLLTPAKQTQGAERAAALAEAYVKFNKAIIDAVVSIVPAVKPQIAMYEALGTAGIDAYVRTAKYAHSKGLYVLGDVKRGDIGSTATAYAAHLSGLPDVFTGEGTNPSELQSGGTKPIDLWHEDAITVNPYLGSDGIDPFTKAAQVSDKDIFVLVRTSNPSSSQLQELVLADSGETVATRVGDLVESWGSETHGHYGYSRLGAVVGATHPQAGAQLRRQMPHTFFLVPGYGAQGGSAADVAAMFDHQGRGALVNSSRGIIGAWKNLGAHGVDTNDEGEALAAVARGARTAAEEMKTALNTALDERITNK